MNFDFWYGNTLDDVAFATCTFYGKEGIYRGNVYDGTGRIIGDYSARDSVLIGETFPGIFD